MSALRATTSALPGSIPLFPLPGTLLLPRGQLPLNIFEPRYLNMTEDALGQGRLIGMVQPQQAVEGLVPDDTPIFATGCAGRITSFSETEDSRFLLTLTGVHRFRVIGEEMHPRGYRLAQVDYAPYAGDLGSVAEPLAERGRLIGALRAYLGLRDLQADWSAIDKTGDEELVVSLAMSCPFQPADKQALLESSDLTERTKLLVGLMEMAVLKDGEDDETARH